MSARILLVLLCTSTFIGASSQSFAGICAKGQIESISEGADGTNDLTLTVTNRDGTVIQNLRGVSVENSGRMRFTRSVNVNSLEGIRTLAQLAAANGNDVEIWTNTKNTQGLDDCTNASELRVFRLSGN